MDIVRLVDEIGPDFTIKDRTFEDLKIVGPAILAPLAGNTFSNSIFEGNPESIFYEVDAERPLIGVIALIGVTFNRCEFSNVGIIGTTESLNAFKASFSQDPAPSSPEASVTSS